MALRAGYKGIKKYIADMLNAMSPGDGIATDAEVSDAFDTVVGWNQEDTHDTVETLLNGKVDNSVVGPVEDGETASQAYAVDERFIRDGKFCTVIAAIAAEATLTKDTNYIEDSLANFLSIKSDSITVYTISGITFAQSVRFAYKFGNVVNFRLMFVADSEISIATASNFALLPYLPQMSGLSFIAVNTETHAPLNNVFRVISTGQLRFMGTIPAGTYDVSGVYLSK